MKITTRPEPLMRVTGLSVSYGTPDGVVQAVRDVSFSVQSGETVGIVGESGSGKSSVARACVGLLPGRAELSGVVLYRGVDLLSIGERKLRQFRGRKIGYVFQDPMNSLNPVLSIRTQLAEAIRRPEPISRKARHELAVAALEQVGIERARRRIREFPHQFSGGMRQRIGIASAVINAPDLVIADEPTTALDVTIQAQVLEVLSTMSTEMGLAMLFVTHDMGVVARMCDRVLVMYAGQVVEQGDVERIFRHPRHPYTRALLEAVPDVDRHGQLPKPIDGTPYVSAEGDSGCAFRFRCPLKTAECEVDPPVETSDGREFRCWRPLGDI